MFEHRHELQTQLRTVPGTMGRDKVTVYRFVCSCGKATSFRIDIGQARRERDRHAFDGQLADPSPIAL